MSGNIHYCANPLNCRENNRQEHRIRLSDKVSYYSDDKLYSMLYFDNSYYEGFK